jgi:hypothetical protein
VRFTLLRCQACALNGNAAMARQAYRAIITSILIFLVGSFIMGSMASEAPSLKTDARPQKSNLFQLKPVNETHRTPAPKLAPPIKKQYSSMQAMFIGWEFGALIVCIYWGFKFHSDRTNGLIVVGNPAFWFFYLMMRLFIALFVGLYAGPRKIYESVRQIRLANRTRQQIERGAI